MVVAAKRHIRLDREPRRIAQPVIVIGEGGRLQPAAQVVVERADPVRRLTELYMNLEIFTHCGNLMLFVAPCKSSPPSICQSVQNNFATRYFVLVLFNALRYDYFKEAITPSVGRKMTYAVYKALTADGRNFDFCVAEDEAKARAIISYLYKDEDEEHFVGDARRSNELLDGFTVEIQPQTVPEKAIEYARLAEAKASAETYLPEGRGWRARKRRSRLERLMLLSRVKEALKYKS